MGAFAEEYLFFEDDYSETNYKEEWSPDELFEEQDVLSEENTVLEEIEDESESDATLEDPVINATPNMETAKVDDDVVITATVSGTTGTVAYQWQVSKDGGNTLANSGLTGNKTEELRFVATEARLANQYRCAVTDENGTWYSNEVQVTLETEPEVTAEANMETAKVDDNVVITATVSGTTGTVAYQWQVSKDGGNTWTNTGLAGNKTEELRFVATKARLANQYRCAVTDENGTWYSNEVQVELEKNIVWNDVLYKILTPSTCSVSSYTGNETTLVIPETVEGMTVTEIGEEAFMGNASLESIDLPDTIIIIRARAFKNCTNLREMK